MGVETLGSLTASIYRETGGRPTIPEIQKEVNDALDAITNQTSWEFLLKQSNINTNATYTTGKINGVDGTNIINLVGGTWNTAWQYKWIYFGQNFAPFQITQFNSSTQAVLATALNNGHDLVLQGYTLYQDLYELPSDMSFGREVLILNTQYYVKLYKPYRGTAEANTIFTRFWFNNFQTMYTDAGTSETNGAYLIKMFPIPSSPQVYPIIYYRQIPYLANDSDTTVLPREFDEAIVHVATSSLLRRYKMPGWKEEQMEGAKMIRDLRKVVRTSSAYDLFTSSQQWPYAQDSSIVDGYAIIGPAPSSGSM